MRKQINANANLDASGIDKGIVIDSIDDMHTARSYIHAIQLMANGLSMTPDPKEDANAFLLVSIQAMDFTLKALNTLQEEVNGALEASHHG